MEAFFGLKDNLKVPLFMEIPIIPALGYMYSQKKKIFKNQRPSFSRWKEIYFLELRMVIDIMKKKHANTFKEWSQSVNHKHRLII
jgi:hypothetical protein